MHKKKKKKKITYDTQNQKQNMLHPHLTKKDQIYSGQLTQSVMINFIFYFLELEGR